MLAYSVVAAHLCFKSWTRRFVFVAAALATTILANALRAYGTMVAAEIWGIEAAGGIDHIFYGWIFFGLVILLVMLVALRWFDRPANDVAVDVSGLTGRSEEHTSELQSLMRKPYAVFCFKKN